MMTTTMTTLAAALVALAAAPDASPAMQQVCDGSEVYERLDFWIGEWDVFVGDRQVGTNRIERVVGGCAVMEHWQAAGGGEGKSLFYVPPQDSTWQQVWVAGPASRPGAVKEKRLEEILDDGALRFVGRVPLPGGGSVLDRTTLTPLEGGRVRQVIEISRDDGESWLSRFDAVYVPAG